MIVTTTQNIPGYEVETLEIVFGNTVRAKHVGKDIMAGLKSIVGGELRGYSEMLADARAEAMSRMVDDAKRLVACKNSFCGGVEIGENIMCNTGTITRLATVF